MSLLEVIRPLDGADHHLAASVVTELDRLCLFF